MRSSEKINNGEKALPLSCFKAGQRGVIASIRSVRQTDLYRFRALGLIPGASVFIERTFPVLALRLPYSSLFLDIELAENILVYPTGSLKSFKKSGMPRKKIGRFSFYPQLK